MLRVLLDRLQGVQRTTDPVFGALKAQGPKAPWEGSVNFAPTRNTVDVLLDAGPAGPTSTQRRYLSELSGRYETLFQEIQKLLPGDASGYELVCIDFQSHDPFSGRVELTYERTSDHDLQFISITGWHPELFTLE